MNRLFSIGIIVMLCAFGNAYGQSPARNPRFLEAQRLESEGQIAEAAAIYEELYETAPNDLFFWKLIGIYEAGGYWEKLAELARMKLSEDPDYMEAHRYLFRALYGSGDRESARAHLLGLADGRWGDAGIINLITSELQVKGEYTDATGVYERARTALNDRNAYALELARLYQYRELYRDALAEYVRALDTHSTAYARCTQVISLAREEGVPADSLAAPIIEYLGEHPMSIKAAKLATGILVRDNRHEQAFALIKAPAAEAGTYADIWNLAESAEQAGKPALAIDIYDEFCRSFPENESCIRARMHAARLNVSTGAVDEARKRYNRIISDAAGSYEASAAALRLIVLSRAGATLDEYTALLAGFAETAEHRETTYEAYLILGDTYLASDMPDEAVDAYSKAKLNARATRERYDSSVRLTYQAFYTGAFDRMGPEIQQALAVAPDGADINDLLALHILRLRCATEHDRNRFTEYAAARYAAYRGETSDAERQLREIAVDTESVVAPAAAVALGALYEEQDRPQEALDTYLAAAEAAGDTTVRVGASLAAATLAETMPGGEDRAKSLYLDILSHYPGTVYDTELRTRLKALTEP